MPLRTKDRNLVDLCRPNFAMATPGRMWQLKRHGKKKGNVKNTTSSSGAPLASESELRFAHSRVKNKNVKNKRK